MRIDRTETNALPRFNTENQFIAENSLYHLWALETAQTGFIIQPINDNSAFVSAEARKMLGLPSQSGWMDMEQLIRCYHTEDQKSLLYYIRQHHAADHTSQFKARTTIHAPARILGHRLSLRYKNLQQYVVIAVHDITEIEQAHQSLIIARDQAQRHDRAQSAFIATMSHELRTPLNAIIGFAELMAEQILGPLGHERYHDYARDIVSSGHNLLTIINDILDLSRLSSGCYVLEEEKLSVATLFARARVMVAGNGTVTRASIQEKLESVDLCIRGDRRALLQALVHLLNNALRHTPVDGQIELGAALEQDGALIIWVSDNGRGISSEELPRVMLPFERGGARWDQSRHGAGLGLPLVKSLIEAHDGHIRLFSREHRGTVISMIFPSERVSLRPPRPTT